MKDKKTLVKYLAMTALACTMAGGSFAMQSANAQDEVSNIAESGFEMLEGASVRLHPTELGIRWTTTVTKSFYESIKTSDNSVAFHTLVGPATDEVKEDIKTLTVDYATANDFYDFPCEVEPTFSDEDENPETEDTFTYYGAIYYNEEDLVKEGTDYTLEASTMELIARAYVSVDGAITYAKANDTARSMKGVASYCLENDLHKEYELNKYVGDADKVVVELEESEIGYYESSDNAGSAVVENLPNGKYIAYVGAKQVVTFEKTDENREIAFSQLPNFVDGKTLVDGEDYSLRLIDENGEMFKTTFKKVTEIIMTQADLQRIFKITSYETVSGKDVWGNSKDVLKINEFDGYYLLGDDIKAEAGSVHRVLPGDYVFKSPYDGFAGNYGKDSPIKLNFGANSQTNIDRAKAEIAPKDNIFLSANGSKDLDTMLYHQGGLTGTFDGNGHTIEDLYIYGPGIFGIVDGGTIKNVAFKNVKFTGVNKLARATLAYSMANATLENVYIQTEELSAGSCWASDYGGYYANASTDDARVSRALVAMSAVGTITMNNCVFVCPEIEATQVLHTYSYASLFGQAYAFQRFNSASSVENVYVVSPYALGANSTNKSTVLYWYDSNVSAGATKEEIAAAYNVKFVNAPVIHSAPAGVKRYDDALKMQEAENDYASFSNSGYWSLDSDGLPVWGKPIA